MEDFYQFFSFNSHSQPPPQIEYQESTIMAINKKIPFFSKIDSDIMNIELAAPENTVRKIEYKACRIPGCVEPCPGSTRFCKVLLEKGLKGRQKLIRNNLLCFVCLRPGHGSQSCTF